MNMKETTKKELDSFTGDKRSLEYRELKKNYKLSLDNENKGLGDTIAKVFKATGIDKIAKAVLGDDCGCEERKAKLNRMFPRTRKQVRCLTHNEYLVYGNFKEGRNKSRLEKGEVDYLFNLYQDVFNIRFKKARCNSCALAGRVKLAMSALDQIYDNYK